VGWGSFERKHNWEQMVENVDNFIRSLNYGYENALRDQGVEYINAVAAFTDPHNVTFLNSSGEPQSVSSERFIIAVGGRPAYPAIPGATLGLSSDDIFWWKKVLDGKTLVGLYCVGEGNRGMSRWWVLPTSPWSARASCTSWGTMSGSAFLSSTALHTCVCSQRRRAIHLAAWL
jgi:hypothetical protein